MKMLKHFLWVVGFTSFVSGCVSAVETGDVPKDQVTVGKEQPKDPETDSLKVLEKEIKTEVK